MKIKKVFKGLKIKLRESAKCINVKTLLWDFESQKRNRFRDYVVVLIKQRGFRPRKRAK
eukprot:UN07109